MQGRRTPSECGKANKVQGIGETATAISFIVVKEANDVGPWKGIKTKKGGFYYHSRHSEISLSLIYPLYSFLSSSRHSSSWHIQSAVLPYIALVRFEVLTIPAKSLAKQWNMQFIQSGGNISGTHGNARLSGDILQCTDYSPKEERHKTAAERSEGGY